MLGDVDSELAMYNKLGDLYVKVGNVSSGVSTYEKAVDRYTDSGFPNNAIALGRTPVYLKLAKLMVDRGFLAEAKRNLLEYAERMQKSGQLEDAFRALKEFADLSPDNEEIRLLLAEQLQAAARTEEAREQLAKLYAEVESTGDERRTRATLDKLKAIDPEYDVEAAPKVTVKKKKKTSDLIFLDLDEPVPAEAEEPVEEPAEPEVVAVAEAEPVEAAVEFEPTSYEEETAEAVEALIEEVGEALPEAVEIEPTSLLEETEAMMAEGVDVQRESADYLTVDEGDVQAIDGLDVETEFEAPSEEDVEGFEFEPTAVEDVSAETPVIEAAADVVEETVPETFEEFVADEAVVDEPELAEDVEPAAVAEVDVEAIELPTEVEAEAISVIPEEEPAVEEEPLPVEVVEEEIEAAVEDALVAVDEIAVVEEEPPLEVEEVAAATAEPEEIEEPVAVVDDRESEEFIVEVEEPEDLELVGAGAGGDLGVEIEADTSIWDETEVGELEVPELDLGAFDVEEPAAAEGAVAGAVEAPEEAGIAELEAPVAEPDLEQLEIMVADEPEDPELHRALAEALIENGVRERGLEELDIALRLQEQSEEWSQADRVIAEILRLDPNSIRHHQKRVELAFQQGDKGLLAGAYLGLADALFRTGAGDRARAVYQRVLEHDPENEQALMGLSTLEPVEEAAPEAAGVGADAAPASGDFVDLGALILEEEDAIRDTRMRIQDEEPTGDEQKDFEEMLSEFKRGIEANLADEDWQAHYDLGVAFKEMGLLDEAIAEFQKALRSPEGRLQTAEALGLCFYEKGQHSVAGTVLRRAVDTEPGGDESKIGLLYWLARCEEVQGKGDEALTHYQRVFAVDINFEDVDERVRGIAGG
jgi:tetratricopeptide (TPR) repeat protein